MNLEGTRNWLSPSIGKQSQSGTARFRRYSTDTLIGASKAACTCSPSLFPCLSPFFRVCALSLDANRRLAVCCRMQLRRPRVFASQHAKAGRLWQVHICSLPALAPAQHLPISRSACLTVFHTCFGAGFTPSRPRPTVPIHGNQFARTIFIPPVGLGFKAKGLGFRV